MVALTTAEWRSLLNAIQEGVDYMDVNGYADDFVFPEDQAAARAFHGSVSPFDICWAQRP